MIRVVTDQKYAPLFAEFLNEKLQGKHMSNALYIASVWMEGEEMEILAVAALHQWTTGACELNLASNGAKRQKWNADWIRAIFDCAFNFAKKGCILAHIALDNEKSQRLDQVLGFTKIGQIDCYYGEGKDALLYSITKQQWLDGKWAPAGQKE